MKPPAFAYAAPATLDEAVALLRSEPGARNVAQFFSGPYRVPNIRLTSSALVTNKTPTGTYRAPGHYEGSFFCEPAA